MVGRDFCVKRMHFVKRLLVVPIVLPLCVDMGFKRTFLTALNPMTTKPRRLCRKRPFFEVAVVRGCTMGGRDFCVKGS